MAEKKVQAKASKKAVEVKTAAQLREDLVAKQNDLIASKHSHHLGELTNPHVLTTTRKEIARLKTAIKNAELTEQKEDK